MPELPDLEIFASNLRRLLVGKTIESATVYRQERVKSIDSKELGSLKGVAFRNAKRVGKEIWFELEDDRSFGIHLMLSGFFYFQDPGQRHDQRFRIFELCLDDGSVFGVGDPQGFANVEFSLSPSKAPDALDKEFSLEHLTRLLKRRPKSTVKAILIDQNAVRGIGNAYADEILYAARISPSSAAGRLPEHAVKTLHSECERVLRWAIKRLQEVTPNAIAGENRSFLKVHTKDRKTTETGHTIQVDRTSGKITYFTDEQVLY